MSVADNNLVVHVRDLVKHYPGTRAVDGISFDVQPGEIFGMVGPNGAGKTTTIECLEGLRRFSATPLRPLTYFVTDVLAPFVMTLLGILTLFLLGTLVYRIDFQGNLLSLLAAITLGALAFFAIGYTLVGLVRNTRATVLIGNVLLYPLMIFSGSVVPLEVMPAGVQNISRFNPLTHLVTLLRGLRFGQGWGDHLTEVAVLAAVAIIGTILVARTFRWE